jgi:hypothetical protein
MSMNEDGQLLQVSQKLVIVWFYNFETTIPNQILSSQEFVTMEI